MDKEYRIKKYNKNKKTNRHRGQNLNNHNTSNTVNNARRKKSTYRRRFLKDAISKERHNWEIQSSFCLNTRKVFFIKIPPSWAYGPCESGLIEGWCNCQGWDYDNDCYKCQEWIPRDVPDTQPVRTSLKMSDKYYDYWGYFKTSRPRERAVKPNISNKKHSLSSRFQCKRNEKPLRAGLRTALVPYGFHPIDEPRWWYLLPHNNKKMQTQATDHDDYLLSLGNYRVRLDNKMSKDSLRQLERELVEDNKFSRQHGLGMYVNQYNLNVLQMLREYKIKHFDYYDRQKWKDYPPISRSKNSFKKFWTQTEILRMSIILPYW